MTTPLKRAVSRKTVILMDNRTQARDRDTIVVTLYPGAVIGFRRLRHRKEVTLPLSACYAAAIKADVAAKPGQKTLDLDD